MPCVLTKKCAMAVPTDSVIISQDSHWHCEGKVDLLVVIGSLGYVVREVRLQIYIGSEGGHSF